MTTIMVVVDRLTKMAHFIPFRRLRTASFAPDAFVLNIFKLHGSLILLFLIKDRNLHLNFGIDYVIFLILLILFLPPTIRRLMVKLRG